MPLDLSVDTSELSGMVWTMVLWMLEAGILGGLLLRWLPRPLFNLGMMASILLGAYGYFKYGM